jgi:hypothetical protein
MPPHLIFVQSARADGSMVPQTPVADNRKRIADVIRDAARSSDNLITTVQGKPLRLLTCDKSSYEHP